MEDLLLQYWWLLLIAALIGLAVAWLVFNLGRKTGISSTRADALDVDAPPAQRNQALIDAPAASAVAQGMPPPAAAGLAGAGTAVSAAVQMGREDDAGRANVSEETPDASTIPTTDDGGSGDDLRRMKGVGPKLVQRLRSLGVTSYAQIAAWDDTDIERIDAQLGNFSGRIRRDDWPQQARFLAAEDMTGFEQRFGKL